MPGSLHYSCMDALHSYELLTAARQAGLRLKTTCTWARPMPEWVAYTVSRQSSCTSSDGDDSVPHVNNVRLGRHESLSDDRFGTIPGVDTFRHSQRTTWLPIRPSSPGLSLLTPSRMAPGWRNYARRILPLWDRDSSAEKVGRIAYGTDLIRSMSTSPFAVGKSSSKKRAVNSRQG